MIEITALAALFAGMLALLSPCSALLLPSFFAYAFSSRRALLARTAVFTLGLLMVLVPLGSGIRALTGPIAEHRAFLITAAGWLVIGFGVLLLAGRGFSLPGGARLQQASAEWAATSRADDGWLGWAATLALGAVYGLAGFCSGPALGAILTVAATSATPGHGAALMAFYALGMAAPLFVLALLWERLGIGRRRWVRGRVLSLGPLRVHTTNLAAGLLFIVVGWFFLSSGGTASLLAGRGMALTNLEFDAQVAIIDFFGATPSWVAPTVAAVVAVAVGGAAWRARSRSAGS